MNISKLKILAWMVLLFILSAGIAIAEDEQIDITNSLIIQASDEAAQHILIRPNLDVPDSTMLIERALIGFWATPNASDSTLVSIRLYALSTDWTSENADWYSPWINPGGDFDDNYYGEYAMFAPGGQFVEIDITDLCMRLADGRLPYYGFLIGLSENSQSSFTISDDPDGHPHIATLSISYSRLAAQ